MDQVKEKATLIDVFDNWIEKSDSENTKDSYRRIIPQFFLLTTGKELSEVTEDDINNLTMLSVQKDYKDYITSVKGYKNNTLRNYLTVISSFFTQLSMFEVFDNVNYDMIRDVILKPNRLKNDKEHRKSMTYNDYLNYNEWLCTEKKFSDRYSNKGYQYSLVLDFMWITAARINATFNTKWSDIKYEEDGLGQFGYTIYINDKGDKTNKQAISEEFYLKLEDEFFEGNKDEKIFKKLSLRGFTNLTKEYVEGHDREFTPHSIRRGAVTYLYHLTHDLVLAQRFAAHEDPKVTVGYIDDNPDRTSKGSYILSHDFDTSEIEKLSRDELLDIIMNRNDLAFGVLQESKKLRLLK